MARVVAFPRGGDVFRDCRGSDRALRVSWHADDGIVVLSIWRDDHCVATARVAGQDVPDLIQTLVQGLAEMQPASSHVVAG